MSLTTFGTRVGVSVGDPDRPTHVAVVREPETGATLRTKGKLYVLVEVDAKNGAARDVGREAAELLRDEYYYDQSAGIDISLRRAIRQANRRAHQKLRGGALHLACAVLCQNELYAARIGPAEVFLVRHARLFVPGETPGELLDYAYRSGGSSSPALGQQADVLATVWRERAEPGDTLLLAGGRAAESLGGESLKNAALTLHPAAAARQLHDRFLAEGGRGAEALLVVELSPTSGAAPRVRPEPTAAAMPDPEVTVIADRIREGLDGAWARRPRLGNAFGGLLGSLAQPLGVVIATLRELVPHARLPLPRATETASFRAARRRRMTVVLAALLILVAGGILATAYTDFAESSARASVNLSLLRAEQEIAAARAAAEKTPPDVSVARDRLNAAELFVAEAVATGRADDERVAAIGSQIADLREKLTLVIADFAKVDPKSAPVAIDFTRNGFFVTDHGAAKLWWVERSGQVSSIGGRGVLAIGAPKLLATLADTQYMMDDVGRLWRFDSRGIREVNIRDRQFREPVDIAVFINNLYVLDRANGQVWKYEPSADGNYNGAAIAFLAQPLGPGIARSIAVDTDVWVTTDEGQLMRFRRAGGSVTASRVDFAIRWSGEALRPTIVQAREEENWIYVLDPNARRVAQLQRDGREVTRIALPTELEPAIGFALIQGPSGNVVVSLHGTRLARTETSR
jgi:hypothetical protein